MGRVSATVTPAPPVLKPRARGWIHLWSFGVSAITGAVLVVLAATTVSTRAALGTAIYSVTVSALFGVSALYHRRTWTTPAGRRRMKRADHSMIFVFIAGSYTPFALLAMGERTGNIVLAVVWVGAALGVLLKTSWPDAPRWLGVPLYLALGWVAVFVLPDLLHTAGVSALVLLLVGGAFYSLGGLAYGIRRPDPWPATFGYHEVFHAATVLAAVCHYVAIWLTIYS